MNGKLVDKSMPPCFSDPYKASFSNRVDAEKRLNSSSQVTHGWKQKDPTSFLENNGLVHPLRVSCDKVLKTHSDLHEEINRRKMQQHETSLNGFVNFKNDSQFEKELIRRQKLNHAHALQYQAKKNHERLVNEYDENSKWSSIHEAKRQDAQNFDKEKSLRERKDNLANQRFLLQQMQESQRNTKNRKKAEIKSDMELMYGAAGSKQEEEAKTVGNLKKAWVKINQDNILKQISMQQKHQENEEQEK